MQFVPNIVVAGASPADRPKHVVRVFLMLAPSIVLFVFGTLVTSGFDIGKLARFLLLPSLFTLIALLAVQYRRFTLASFFSAVAVIFLLAPNGLTMGYGIFYLGRAFPLVDSHLIAVDRILGFDWVAMLSWFNSHPTLTHWLKYPYGTLDFQAIFVVLLLIVSRNHDRAAVLACANALTIFFVHFFAIFFPAIGAYGALGISVTDHPAIELSSRGYTVEPSLALRAASTFVLPEGGIMGLMTFPSYHSAWGALLAWSTWQYRGLRLPGLLLGTSVVVSALIHGSHHLTDALAGVILALICVRASVLLRRALTAAALDFCEATPSLPETHLAT